MSNLEVTEKIGDNYFTINPNDTTLNSTDRNALFLLSKLKDSKTKSPIKGETFFVYKTDEDELVVY